VRLSIDPMTVPGGGAWEPHRSRLEMGAKAECRDARFVEPLAVHTEGHRDGGPLSCEHPSP